jgi:hypothetical protein
VGLGVGVLRGHSVVGDRDHCMRPAYAEPLPYEGHEGLTAPQSGASVIWVAPLAPVFRLSRAKSNTI